MGSSVLLVAIALSPAVIGDSAAEAVPRLLADRPPQVTQPQDADRLPPPVSRRVLREVAELHRIPLRQLTVVQYRQETWPNGCLGLPTAGEMCTMALVPGWRVEVSNGQQTWVYRTDQMARVIRAESVTNASGLSPQQERRILAAIARPLRLPAQSLRIAETRTATFDGCMGIAAPDQVCTQQAIAGWRMIVTNGDRSWVYHVSQEGDRIVQNRTASGSRGGLLPSFHPNPADGTQGTTLVFYAMESGSLAGTVTERFLTSDGVIHRQTRSPLSPQESSTVVEKRLSRQELQRFQRLLAQQQFRNLDQMRYISPASLADYPTMTFKAMGSQVQYTDLELNNLPAALQTVIRAWDRL